MLLIIKDTPYEIDTAVDNGERWVQLWTGSDCISPFDTIDEAVDFIEYLILANRYLLLQTKYLRLKEELEKFLKKKSGYKELRELLKELDNCSSKTTKKRKEMNP